MREFRYCSTVAEFTAARPPRWHIRSCSSEEPDATLERPGDTPALCDAATLGAMVDWDIMPASAYHGGTARCWRALRSVCDGVPAGASVIPHVTTLVITLTAACTAEVPEGRFACSDDTDCPPDWSCWPDARCYSVRALIDGGTVRDAALDDAIGRDGGSESRDAQELDVPGPFDGGIDVALFDGETSRCRSHVTNGMFAELAVHEATCDGVIDGSGPSCVRAIDMLCRSLGCGGGIGPVERAAPSVSWVCAADAVELVVPTSLLTAPCGGAELVGPACQESAHRLCQERSYASGYGPLVVAGTSATLRCFDIGTVEPRAVRWMDLVAFNPYCDGSFERWGPNCTSAIHRECRSHGYVGGYGPVAGSASLATTVCVR